MYYFLTTRLDYTYDVFTEACKKNLENKFKIDLKLILIENKMPSFSFIFFIFKSLVLFKLSKSNLINLKYKQFRVGRFIIPSIFQNYGSYFSVFSYYLGLLKKIYHAGKIIKFLEESKNIKKIKGAYIDHGIYLNGLIIDYFLQKKKFIYSDNYPRTLFVINPNKYLKYEDALRIKKKNNFFYKNKLSKNLKKNIVLNPKSLPWMRRVNFKKIKNKSIYKSYDYIIYAHSFTDAQLTFGYDGFSNVYEWLNFTIDFLRKKNKKIIVKAHPNFFDHKSIIEKKNINPLTYNDSLIYNEIIKKYKNDTKILFINESLNNIEFLKLLDNKKHILITHHGTAIIETAYFRFKTISSAAAPWDKDFRVSNSFSNIKKYKYLLNQNINKLKLPNLSDLNKLIYEVYFSDFSMLGKKSYYFFYKKNINFNKSFSLQNRPKLIKKLKKNKLKKSKLILDLSKNIEIVN